jgi:hypothetical protein
MNIKKQQKTNSTFNQVSISNTLKGLFKNKASNIKLRNPKVSPALFQM